MTLKTGSGLALLAASVLMFVNNLSGQLADLKDWHDASTNLFTPAFVSASLQQLVVLLGGAIGGNLLRTMGAAPKAGGGQ